MKISCSAGLCNLAVYGFKRLLKFLISTEKGVDEGVETG
jgi:hypothetical protein